MDQLNVLAMDGGNGYNTASVLTGVQTQLGSNPDASTFLNGVDLFAGTSDGGINALYLAFNENPTAALAGIGTFWQDILKDMSPCADWNPGSLLGALVGHRSILSSEPMEQTFIEYFGQDTTLGDLPHKVLIVSFQLDNERERHPLWVPRFFTNWGPHATPDEKVVDVALRTSALPIEMPIYQAMSEEGPGFVDGGVVANNPGMCALSRIIEEGRGKNVDLSTLLGETVMWSIGTGRNALGSTTYLDPEFENGRASWGYGQWMLDPARPLLLLDLVLQAGGEAVSDQCRQILHRQFFRTQPMLKKGLVPNDPETTKLLKETIAWMKSVGWVSRQKPAATKTAKKSQDTA